MLIPTLWTKIGRLLARLFPPPEPEPGDVDDLMALVDCLYDNNTTIRTADLDTAVIPKVTP